MNTPERARHWVDYKYLLGWMRAATKGLSGESRARIREEITDHFHQALDDGLDAGLSEDVAARQAVEALGSPSAARRGFRRTYLSRRQGYLLRRFIEPAQVSTPNKTLVLAAPLRSFWDPARERRARPFMACMFTALSALGLALDPPVTRVGVGLLAIMVAAAIVITAAVPRLARRGRERAAVASGAAGELVLGAAYLLAPSLHRPQNLNVTTMPRRSAAGTAAYSKTQAPGASGTAHAALSAVSPASRPG